MIRQRPFGEVASGEPVDQFTLENMNGMRVDVLTYGGVVRSVVIRNTDGSETDVALGFDTLDEYVADSSYIGALVGRYANRIAGARFTIDGTEYQLAANEGANQLHGGPAGFNRHVWTPRVVEDGPEPVLELSVHSPKGDQGFPGALDVRATYTLSARNELAVAFRATCDASTHVNLTLHSYWNLRGHDAGDIFDHELTLNASRFLPVNAALIPTGDLRGVDGTVFDFRRSRRVGGPRVSDDEQLRLGGGYDHCFVLNPGETGQPVARVTDPSSGHWLEVTTTEPGIQFYMGQGLHTAGKGGARYAPHSGLALETQHFPNSPNQPSFPSTLLRAGEAYLSRTQFRFG